MRSGVEPFPTYPATRHLAVFQFPCPTPEKQPEFMSRHKGEAYKDGWKAESMDFLYYGQVLEPEQPDATIHYAGGVHTSTGNTIAEPMTVWEADGRGYHGYDQGAYSLPNDAAEQDRLDLQHTICKIALDGKLYMAPITSMENVLDIATGTGIWAIELAQANPNTHVIGTDLSLIQPDLGLTNCEFIRENSEASELIFPQKFDLIHARAILSCFDSTPTVFEKAFNHTKPGGWIDVLDATFPLQCLDDSLKGTALEKWSTAGMEGGARVGRDMAKSKHYKQWLENAGYVNVQEKFLAIPGGPWAKDPKFKKLGAYFLEDMKVVIPTVRKFLQLSGLSELEIDKLLVQAQLDIRNPNIHWFMPMIAVWGQKPEAVGEDED